MKKVLLLLPVLIFCLFGCAKTNDTQTSSVVTSSLVTYTSSVENEYSDIVKHFEERDSTVVSIHQDQSGFLTILVLCSYHIEVYQAVLIGDNYSYTLVNRL